MPQNAWNRSASASTSTSRTASRTAARPNDKAKEIAARTVNKERARRRGEGVVETVAGGHLLGPPRRAALGHEPPEGTNA